MSSDVSMSSEAFAPDRPFFEQMSPEKVLEQLDSSAKGLDREAASTRLKTYGLNRLPDPPKPNALIRFLRQFHNMLIYLLLGAAVITMVLGHMVDASIILAVVLINALIGYIQEGKAEQAMDSIRKMLSPGATVIRGGMQVHLDAENLVPGDVVVLSAGDKVPADLRLLEQRDLKIEESALTGESVAVNKDVAAVMGGSGQGDVVSGGKVSGGAVSGSEAPDRAMIADRRCMAYSGTAVVYGQGRGVVVATGRDTEIGKISTMMSEVEPMSTPLLKQFFEFGRTLSVAILVISALLFGFGAWMAKYETHELFLAVISLAVAAIPEGLPAIMTITMAVGVQVMARQNAIVRHLPSIETLGSVSVICTDKTGTLTKNEMTVRSVVTSGGRFDVTGSGYQPVGRVVPVGRMVPVGETDGGGERAGGSEDVQGVSSGADVGMDGEADGGSDALLQLLVRSVKGCNDAALMIEESDRPSGKDTRMGSTTEDGMTVETTPSASSSLGKPAEITVVGDPTEGALITLAHKAGLGTFEPSRLDTIPFDSTRKWMATLHTAEEGLGQDEAIQRFINPTKNGQAQHVIFVKGAPEVLMEMCSQEVCPDRAAYHKGYDGLSTQPLRSGHWQRAMAREAEAGHRVIAAAVKVLPADASRVDASGTGASGADETRAGVDVSGANVPREDLSEMNASRTDMARPGDQSDQGDRALSEQDLEGGLLFLGLIGMMDPPRPEAIEAIRVCKKAGIDIKMITGDHLATARAIGSQLGLGASAKSHQPEAKAIRGDKLEAMSDEELQEAVLEYDIFARTSPEHKLRLVRALQHQGRICAMTGDGVNDAPALKQADIGISMGIKGTEVTKEASDMVLADDHFASIANAVRQGRTIYSNLRKTVLFFLPTDGAESIVIIAALLLGITLPITPAQVLWVNMITAVTLSLALCFEPAEPGVMLQSPRRPAERILNRYLVWRLLMVSVFLGGAVLWLFLWLEGQGVSLDVRRTVAVNTLVMGQLFYLLNCRRILDPAIDRGFFGNKAVFYSMGTLVVFQVLFTHAPFMNVWFRSASHDAVFWVFPLVAGLMLFALVELEKMWMRSRVQRAAT